MQQQRDYQRLQSLYNQRLLQIKRQGIIVQLYHTHQILPAYLQCTYSDLGKLQAFLDSKMSLELCDLNGLPLIKIGKKSYFTKKSDLYNQHRVYLQNKNAYRSFQQGPFYILVKNNATIGVLSQILHKRIQGDRYFHKIQDFIGDDTCKQIDLDENMSLQYENQSDLNQQQNQAIQKSFTNHLTFIKGPPGCGKTKTVSRMVKLLAQRNLKVLVGSISNIANQSLISEIVSEVRQHNYLCEMFPQSNMKKLLVIINYSRKALQKINQQAKYFSINNQLYYYILNQNTSEYYHQDNIMDYIWKLQLGQTVPNNFWAIYMKSYNKLISDVNIVISTTINSFKLYKYTGFRPNVGIVDEAAQASWTDTYGFLAFGVTRMIFVGDQKQLKPIVIGDCNVNEILKQTMFERLSQKNKNYFVHLTKQYRMHPKISQFVNQYIYQGKLVDAITQNQRQTSIDYFNMYPISFITHQFPEQVYEINGSLDSQKTGKQFYNQYQGSLIMDLLFTIPLTQWQNIGILTFYDMQCQILTSNLQQQVENFDSYGLTIKTIDGYQGGQKDYIFVSTVRSNPEKNPGFCIELNRVNVALTRAKRGLIVFGDQKTLNQGQQNFDVNQNIWGKFYNLMLQKNQVLNYSKYHQIISKMKHKSFVISSLYQIYLDSLSTLESQLFSKTQLKKDISSQKNQIIFKQTKQLMNQVINFKFENKRQYIKDKILHFLSINQKFIPQQIKNNQNQIQQLTEKGFTIVKNQQKTFKQKLTQIINLNHTQKQNQYQSYFVHLISKDLYEIISKYHNLQKFNILINQLITKVNQEQNKLIESSLNHLSQLNDIKLLTDLKKLKQSQTTALLVSSKLIYQLIQLYKNQFQKCLVFTQATQTNQI